jgi:hypothetical protein
MPGIVWILVWAVILGTVAFFAIREIRRGRKRPDDFDRTVHAAVRDAESRMHTQGPNGVGQSYWGG